MVACCPSTCFLACTHGRRDDPLPLFFCPVLGHPFLHTRRLPDTACRHDRHNKCAVDIVRVSAEGGVVASLVRCCREWRAVLGSLGTDSLCLLQGFGYKTGDQWLAGDLD